MPPKPERRPQILRAAAKLFRERGYHATTMDELAAELGLNKATVYHHFADGKQGLLYQIYISALDELLGRLDQVDQAAYPLDRLRHYVAAMVGLQLDRPDETVVYFQERGWLKRTLPKGQIREFLAREGRATHLVQSAIEEGIAAGELVDVDPQLATAALMSVVSSTHRWMPPREFARSDDVIEFCAKFAIDGLRPSAVAGRRA